MDSTAFLEAIKTVGMPVAVAAFLIWHFVVMNRSLQASHNKMQAELGRLTAELAKATAAAAERSRLLDQSEKLTVIIEERNREAQTLLRLLVEAQINRHSPHTETSAVTTRDGRRNAHD